jgi:hypothetical protein
MKRSCVFTLPLLLVGVGVAHGAQTMSGAAAAGHFAATLNAHVNRAAYAAPLGRSVRQHLARIQQEVSSALMRTRDVQVATTPEGLNTYRNEYAEVEVGTRAGVAEVLAEVGELPMIRDHLSVRIRDEDGRHILRAVGEKLRRGQAHEEVTIAGETRGRHITIPDRVIQRYRVDANGNEQFEGATP